VSKTLFLEDLSDSYMQVKVTNCVLATMSMEIR